MQVFTVFTALALPLAWASPQFQSKQVNNFTVGQVVETSSGPVTGHAAPGFPEVSEYLGIPFAQALRFAAPVKYHGSSALNGSLYGFSCPTPPSSPTNVTAAEIAAANATTVGLEQFDTVGNPDVVYSEDCLNLNIWTKPQSGEAQKAVMVWIHGGAFSGGTASTPYFNGSTLAEQEDVIIVGINYRLSILGFPGNPNAQNNLAFLDQRLAMEWVRENIANFGGDPERITLVGQSAGAASVDYYAYAWTSDPIANGIILESGTTFSFALPYSQSDSAASWYKATTTLGCGNATTNSTTLLECMRNVDVDTLIETASSVGEDSLLITFGPTADNKIVFSNYSEQTPASIPVLVGSNDYEPGIWQTELALANETFPDWIWDAYNLAGFTCPAGQRANASIAAGNPTWRYRFFGVWPNINISSEGGAYHGTEIQLLFGTTPSTPNATVDEIAFETYLRGAWTTFAKDPVDGLTTYEDGWPMWDPAEETLIRLAYNNSVGTNLALPMLYDAGCATANLTALYASVFS